MPKSEPFTSVDAAWLHMDQPANLAMITGVLMFDAPLDFARLKATYQHRLLPAFPRFRQRVREPRLSLGLPRWELDPNFALDHHLGQLDLAAPGDDASLQALAGELMARPLDRAHPLWHITLVRGYGAGSALICRLHHCIADGLALVQVLLSLTDTAPDAAWPKPPAEAGRRPPRGLVQRLVARTTETVDQTLTTAEHWLHDGTLALQGALHPAEQLAVGGLYALALGKLTLLGPDQRTLLRGRCEIPKRAAWSRPVPLAVVKAIGQSLDGTINDVLLAAAVGGLRRYLERNDQVVDRLNLRALVPVNLRPSDELARLSNRFGLVLLSLPVGVREPLRRIRVLKKRMDAIKDSPEAVVAFGILGAMGLTPAQVEDLIVKFFAAKASAVMTNVPGPREVLYFAGQPLKGLMFWVPQPGNLALGLSILSYAGAVRIGVATDAGLVPDPETIVAGFEAELDALRRTVRPARAAPPPTHPAQAPRAKGRCQAQTRSGQRCRNQARPGSKVCHAHRGPRK